MSVTEAVSGLRGVASSVSVAQELPRLVQVREGVTAAAFDLMKLLPARYILDRAEQKGSVDSSVQVLETSSGTFALALAMICKPKNLPLTIVTDPGIEAAMKMRLRLLGAKVEVVRGKALERGVQQARLDRLAELCDRHPRHFVPEQYDNPDNARAYTPVAELILEAIGQIDCLVGTVGSGGSTNGIASVLRGIFPSIHVIGVDTPGSVLFGSPPAKRLLRGLGSSIMPKNVDHSMFDEIHWISAESAFTASRWLYQNQCLYVGPTSGAANLVAAWWAKRNPGGRVVVLFPDTGFRYERTVFSKAWRIRNGVDSDVLPEGPSNVDRPNHVVGGTWFRMDWGRRTLAKLTGDVAE